MLKKKLTRQQIKEKARQELERVLDRTGYYALKAKHGRVKINRFTDLKVDNSHLPRLSDTIGNGFVVRTGAKHPDAKQFPIGNDHKSGVRLIIATDDLKFMSGRKT